MEKFNVVSGIAAPMPRPNIDTDQIIPARFLRTTKRTGLGIYLFNELRFKTDGSENPSFILNQTPYRDSALIIAGDNFGCGSSREHAPWALLDFGIRCIISTGFADIFFNNCFKNGLLPIVVNADELAFLIREAENQTPLTVNLDKQTISLLDDTTTIDFDVDPFRKHCLKNGLDDIGLTLEKEDKITAFEEVQKSNQPWLYP